MCQELSEAVCFLAPNVLFSIPRGTVWTQRQLRTLGLTQSCDIWTHGLMLPPYNHKISLKHTSKGNQTSPARNCLSNLVSTPAATSASCADQLHTDTVPVPAEMNVHLE